MIWTRFTDLLLRRGRDAAQPGRPAAFRTVSSAAAPVPDRRRLPHFQGTASDPDRVSASSPDPGRASLLRAFTPSQPVNDVRMFAGRKDLLLTLIRAIEEQQLHVVLFGDRGIGKTSLLHILTQLAREARYIVRYTSCSETSEFDPTFRAIADEIPLLYHADFDPTSDAAERGATLAELLPEKTLTVAQTADAFAKLSGTRVLIVLDEFDRAGSVAFKRSVAELIKTLSDKAIRVQIVIAGVAANLTELMEHIPSIRRNVLGLPVRAMSRDELVELIRLGEAVGSLAFDDEAVDRIVDAAQGSPYVAGLLAQQSATAVLDRRASGIGSKNVGGEDVAFAVRRTLSDIKIRVAPRERLALERVEAEVTIADAARIAGLALHNFGVIPADRAEDPSSAPAVARLEALGAVRPVSVDGADGHAFVDDSIPLYLWLRGQLRER